MKARLVWTTALIAAAAAVWSAESLKPPVPTKPKLALSIKPQHVADALRAVIMADREVYTRLAAAHDVALLPGNGSTTTRSPEMKPLPSPCELLRLGSQAVAAKGVEFSYVLRSLQPLQSRNTPETDAEVKGLQFVSTRPDLTYQTEELLGGRWYYTAVYPDTAVSESCIACHRQGRATGPELRTGDVLGALVVRIALEL
jgi:hypothetical protein